MRGIQIFNAKKANLFKEKQKSLQHSAISILAKKKRLRFPKNIFILPKVARHLILS